MKLEMLSASVVVVAQGHNPTILHPAFLSSQGIVPVDWETAEPPVCTPAFAVVRFSNDIVFVVDAEKFQVSDNRFQADPAASPLSGLTTRYIEKLPHVRYTAVGINFEGFAACDAPESHIIKRFLKQGPWSKSNLRPQALGLTFVYPLPDATLRLTCDAAKARQAPNDAGRTGLLVRANYHKELAQTSAMEEARIFLRGFANRFAHFRDTATTVLGLEG